MTWNLKFALCFFAFALLMAVTTCFAQTLTAKRYSTPWTLAHCERASFGIVKPVAVFNVSTGDGQWEPTCR